MPFNLTGNPAVSLPCGFDAAGMPLAIQLVARPGEDAELLRVAAAFEGARPWASVQAERRVGGSKGRGKLLAEKTMRMWSQQTISSWAPDQRDVCSPIV